MEDVDVPTDGHRRECHEPVVHSLRGNTDKSRTRRTRSASRLGSHDESRPDSPAARANSTATRTKEPSDDRFQQQRDKSPDSTRISPENRERSKDAGASDAKLDSRSSATLEVRKRSPLSSSSSLQPRPGQSTNIQPHNIVESASPHGIRKWWTWKRKRQEEPRREPERRGPMDAGRKSAKRYSESSTILEAQKPTSQQTLSSQQRRSRQSYSLQRRKTTDTSSPTGVRRLLMRLRGEGEDSSRRMSYIMRIYERERAEKVCRLLYAGLFALFLLMFAYFVVRALTPSKDIRVRTPMGLVDGTQQWVLERNVFYYLGLPYAFKPARFQRALPLVHQLQPNNIVPKRPNVRCLQVTPNGSNSAGPQSPADRGGYAQPIEYSEDCLYLNVWSPAEPCDYTSSSCGPALPVLAVLFSVGFVRGGADWYDGAVLASLSGMVVVAPNFRLGPLAVPIKEIFMRLCGRVFHTACAKLPYTWTGIEGMDEKNPQGLPLLTSSDQLQAIHWMWHNIRHFGGNISQINVLGAGGGAWTVGELLLSNRESFRDHIQRVALHGGSPLRRYAPIRAYLVEKALGCGPASSECLDTADSSLLDKLASLRLQGPPAPLTVAEARPGNQRVVLLGFVAGQGKALLDDLLHDIVSDTSSEPAAEQWLGALQHQLNLTGLKALFDDAREKNPPGADIRVRFLEDLLVRCPVELFSDLVRGISFISYGFVYVTDSDAAEGDEPANAFPDLDLLFGVPLTAPNRMYPERLKQASLLFIKAWATFMKTGRLPAVNGDPWPVVIEDTPKTALEVVIRDGFKLSAPTRFADKTCVLINEILRKSVTDQDGDPSEFVTNEHHV